MSYAGDPACGFVASANAKPQRDDAGGPFLGLDWLDGYRQTRIGEALAARDGWDVASTQALQMDQTSLAWREIRDAVGRAASDPAVVGIVITGAGRGFGAGLDGAVLSETTGLGSAARTRHPGGSLKSTRSTASGASPSAVSVRRTSPINETDRGLADTVQVIPARVNSVGRVCDPGSEAINIQARAIIGA